MIRSATPCLMAHLYKEYRENRTSVLGLPALIGVATALLCWLGSGYWVEHSLVPDVTLFAVVGALLVFAPTQSEHGGGTLAFVQRVPGGLNRSFCAKVAFVLIAVVGVGVFTFLLATWLRGMAAPKARVVEVSSIPWLRAYLLPGEQNFLLVSMLLSLCLWSFAASFWIPRATLAVPLAVVVVVLIVLPACVLLQGELVASKAHQGTRLVREYLEWPALHVMHPLLALGAAWYSVVRGRRAGGGAAGSLWRGLAVAGAACAALSTWAASDAAMLRDFVPGRSPVSGAALDPSGRYAWIQTTTGTGADTVIRADLETGAWERMGDGQRSLLLSLDEERIWGGVRVGVPAVVVCSQGPDGERRRLLDATTGELLEATRERSFSEASRAARRRAQRATTELFLPDGRRCWFLDDRLEWERDGEGVDAVALHRSGFPPRGFGLPRVEGRIPDHRWWMFDLTRMREFAVPREFGQFWVLPRAWLCGMPDGEQVSWWMYDPGTGTRRAAHLQPDEEVVYVSFDGRVLTRKKGRVVDAFSLVDPDTGHRALLRISHWKVAGLQGIVPAPAPGKVVLHLGLVGGGLVAVTLDPSSASLSVPISTDRLWVTADRDGQWFDLGGKDLGVRAPGARKRTVLFPR